MLKPRAIKERSDSHKRWALFAALVLNLLVFASRFAPWGASQPSIWHKVNYTVSDWLVNYAGGFVRRGFSGEGLWALSRASGVPAHDLAAILGGSATLGVVLLIGASVLRLRPYLTLLETALLAFSPLLISYYVDPAAIGRKETLFVLFTALHLRLVVSCAREGKSYLRPAALLFFALGVPIALTHEMFLMLGLPTNVLLALHTLGSRRESSAKALLLLFFPVVAALVFATAFHGSPGTVDSICSSWRRLGEEPMFACGAKDDAIGFLASTTAQGLQAGTKAARSGLWMLLLTAAFMAPVLWTLRNARERSGFGPGERRGVFDAFERRYLVLPATASIPLYIFASDWGRWIVTTTVLFLLCSTAAPYLTRPEEKGGSAPPHSTKVLRGMLALGFLGLFLRMPHSFNGYLNSINGLAVQAIKGLAGKRLL